MKIGLYLVPLIAQVESLRAIGQRADRERGIHSLWIPEPHLVAFQDYDSPFPYAEDEKMPAEYGAEGELDGLLALAYLAAVTSRVRIGIGVCIVPQRDPVYVAKEVTTLDHLSNGRFDFGVGIGWLEEEFRVVGASFGDRAGRCSANIGVMQTLWAEQPAQVNEPSGALSGARQEPFPLQWPHPPIHFGGNGRRALERVAALGQGWLPWDLTADEAKRGIAKMEELLQVRDRSRGEIEVSVATTLPVEQIDVADYAAAGVDQLLVVVAPVRSREEVEQLFDRLETTVAAAAETRVGPEAPAVGLASETDPRTSSTQA